MQINPFISIYGYFRKRREQINFPRADTCNNQTFNTSITYDQSLNEPRLRRSNFQGDAPLAHSGANPSSHS